MIIKFDPRKAHYHDKINIQILKFCGKIIYKPCYVIFKSCVKKGVFHLIWKIGNVVPIHNSLS